MDPEVVSRSEANVRAEEEYFAARRAGRLAIFQQFVQGLIALALLGVLVALQFEETPETASGLTSAVRTLAIAVVAFYFGRRLIARRAGEAGSAYETTSPQGNEPSEPQGRTYRR